jgi:NCS1 family nucleobase:cation symporter-1
MIADYFLLRRTQLDTDSLYRRDGIYEYADGINVRAIIALVAGVVVALIGLVIPSLRFLYDYAWFAGFFIAGGVYLALMKTAPAPVPVESLD